MPTEEVACANKETEPPEVDINWLGSTEQGGEAQGRGQPRPRPRPAHRAAARHHTPRERFVGGRTAQSPQQASWEAWSGGGQFGTLPAMNLECRASARQVPRPPANSTPPHPPLFSSPPVACSLRTVCGAECFGLPLPGPECTMKRGPENPPPPGCSLRTLETHEVAELLPDEELPE